MERVTIQNSNPEPTLEEQVAAQEAAAAEANTDPKLAGEENTPERPEWLPEKFATVEDMAKAYKELEGKQSAPKEPEAPAETEEAANEAVDKAGLDMDALSAEWDAEGKLTDESYAKLAEVGITPEMVEMYAAGSQSQADAQVAEMLAPVGGNQETYDDMIAWAADELPDADIDAFNEVLETGKTSAIKLAVQELAGKYNAANGVEPTAALQGNPTASSTSRYESTADLMKDMGNPEYAKNPAFRAKVEAKLARSNIL